MTNFNDWASVIRGSLVKELVNLWLICWLPIQNLIETLHLEIIVNKFNLNMYSLDLSKIDGLKVELMAESNMYGLANMGERPYQSFDSLPSGSS